MNAPIYEIQSLKHSYSGKTILEVDHLAVQPEAIVGLMGPNGSGKSSLLRLLGLIESPLAGKILFNGRPVKPFSDEARFLVTLLPQEPFLMKRSVFKNVSYGLKLRGNGKDAAQKVNDALALVGLPGREFARRHWYELSGGESQRVALAARLALEPKVLLLDEPTAGVDASSAELIKEALLWAQRKLGTTLIIASHNWHWLYEICDEIVHLFRGKIFRKEHQEIVFGPWQSMGSGNWGKILSDGQKLLVTQPPNRDAVAIINNLSVIENDSTTTNNDIILAGIVSRVSLERKTGNLFTTISFGNISLTAGLRCQQGAPNSIFPGKRVNIGYRLDHIKWM